MARKERLEREKREKEERLRALLGEDSDDD